MRVKDGAGFALGLACLFCPATETQDRLPVSVKPPPAASFIWSVEGVGDLRVAVEDGGPDSGIFDGDLTIKCLSRCPVPNFVDDGVNGIRGTTGIMVKGDYLIIESAGLRYTSIGVYKIMDNKVVQVLWDDALGSIKFYLSRDGLHVIDHHEDGFMKYKTVEYVMSGDDVYE